MIEIKSRNNEKISAIHRLLQPKYRQIERRFLVEGYHLVEMAFRHQKLLVILTTETLDPLYDSVEQYLVTPEILQKLSQLTTPPPIIGVCRYLDEEPLQGEKLLYLDTINDPGNFGTILRTALAFGFDGVACSKNTVSLYNPKTIMASQGALFDIKVYPTNPTWLVNMKKTHAIIVSTLQDAMPLPLLHIQQPFILVLGNESHGVSEEVHQIASHRVKIPIAQIDSLNVAIAGAILMYHLSR